MFGRKTRGVLNYKLKRFPNTLSFLLPVCWNLSSNTEHFVLGNCEFMQIVRMILLSTLKYVEYFTTSGISITRSYTNMNYDHYVLEYKMTRKIKVTYRHTAHL